MNDSGSEKTTVAIIGAGPIGLAAAAHLLKRGARPVVLEEGQAVGASIGTWSHVRMFSPWKYNIDSVAREMLTRHGWETPPDEDLPTGAELRDRYLIPLAQLPGMRDAVRVGSRVVSVSRTGFDKVRGQGRESVPFQVVVSAQGRLFSVSADAVIDASGTWANPNPLLSTGLRVDIVSDKIAYGIPDVLGKDADRYASRRVLVVGSGHSAIQSVLNLAQLRESFPDTAVYWSIRGPMEKLVGGGQADQLPARGQLGTKALSLIDTGAIRSLPWTTVEGITDRGGTTMVLFYNARLRARTKLQVDRTIVATGSRPDLSILSEVRLALDPTLESGAEIGPLIDPNLHSCGTIRPHGERALRHPEKDFYVVGAKSYGRAPGFLLLTGYEQVRSIAASLTGDQVAAQRLELVLPETGVCSGGSGNSTSCCGPVAQVGAVADGAARPAGGCC